MADSNFRGPVNAMGSMEFQSGTTATIEPLDGPSMFYQGVGFPDLRGVPFAKDGYRAGQQPAFLSTNNFYAVDNFPQAASSTLLAAQQGATAGTPISLLAAQPQGPGAGIPSVALGVPIIPQGTTNVVTPTLTIDYGFATGTATAASSTVIVSDSTLFTVGQWVVVGGAGNAAGTLSLISQVKSITSGTTTLITIQPTPSTTINNAPIGAGNLFGDNAIALGTQFGPATASASAASLDTVAGLSRVHNPREMIARCVSLTIGTTAATSDITITGYDVWKQPMAEKITIPSLNRGAVSTIFGKKAFKHITSIAVSTTIVGQMSVGVGDVFGMAVRADKWEQTQIFWNGCSIPTSLGFTAAATTAPATNTTGDVRGTIQTSTNGTGTAAAVATATVSNGTARLTIIQSPGVWNTVYSNPNNLVPMFGVTNAST